MENFVKQVLLLVGISAVATAKDTRQYYTAEFQDPENPFGKTVKRNFFQQFNPTDPTKTEWRGADPAKVKAFLGKIIPGYIANEEVEPYEIPGRKGINGAPDQPDRTVNYYTTVVLGHEQKAVVFRTMRHPLINGDSSTSMAQPAGKPNVIAVAGEDELEIAPE